MLQSWETLSTLSPQGEITPSEKISLITNVLDLQIRGNERLSLDFVAPKGDFIDFSLTQVKLGHSVQGRTKKASATGPHFYFSAASL